MKKGKGFLIFLLVAAFVFSMSACSAKTPTPRKTGEQAEILPGKYTFIGEPVRCNGESMPMPAAGVSLQRAVKAGDGVFLYGTDEQGNGRFFLLDGESLEIDEADAFGNEKAEDIAASPDGGLYVLRINEKGDYTISTWPGEGMPATMALDLSGYDGDMIHGFQASDMGFFLTLSRRVLAVDKNGGILHDYGEYRGAQTVIVTGEKIFLIQMGTDEAASGPDQISGTSIIEIDEDFALGQRYHVEPLFTQFFAGAEDQLLAYMNNVLYQYNYASGGSTALINVFTSSMETSSLVIIRDGLYFTLNRGSPTLWCPAKGEETITLTFATYNLSFPMKNAIQMFNASHSSYAVEPIDYAQYDTYETVDAGLTRLTSELISGKAPDIYDLRFFTPDNLAAKGLLEDLKPWFETDGEGYYEELLPCVRKNAEFNGGLYELIPAFKIVTLCGDRSTVGENWGIERFLQLSQEQPPQNLFGPEMTRRDFLSYLLCFMKEELYSEETLKCDFNSENFLALLRYAKELPEDFQGDGNQGEMMGRAYAGEQLLILKAFGDYIVDEISLLNGCFSGEARFVGFPSGSGNGFGIEPCERLAMSASCLHKEGVWEFFRFLLSEDSARTFMGLPSAEPVYTKTLDRLISGAVENLPSAWGASSTGPIQFSGTPVEAETMRAQVNAMMEMADCIAVCDSTVLDIVMDCSQAYFQGGKPVEDVAQEIQSKVSIYLSEQYG